MPAMTPKMTHEQFIQALKRWAAEQPAPAPGQPSALAYAQHFADAVIGLDAYTQETRVRQYVVTHLSELKDELHRRMSDLTGVPSIKDTRRRILSAAGEA